MGKYLSKPDMPNRDFIISRIGRDAFTPPSESRPARMATRLSNALHTRLDRARNLFYRLILGNRFHALEVGQFRLDGEVHLWIYDRYSLSAALERAGFRSATERTEPPQTALSPLEAPTVWTWIQMEPSTNQTR